jgi:hypothetical protein
MDFAGEGRYSSNAGTVLLRESKTPKKHPSRPVIKIDNWTPGRLHAFQKTATSQASIHTSTTGSWRCRADFSTDLFQIRFSSSAAAYLKVT